MVTGSRIWICADGGMGTGEACRWVGFGLDVDVDG